MMSGLVEEQLKRSQTPAAPFAKPAAASSKDFPVVRVVSVFLLVSCCVAVLRFPYTLDDAFITFHYARNFAEGLGLGTWNVGEPPVEGFSSLLWTLLLGWGMKAHLSPFYLSKVIGLLAALAIPLTLLLAFNSSSRSGEEPDGPLSTKWITRQEYGCAAILTALYIPLFYYAVSGMETTFFSLQVLWMLLLPGMRPRPLKGVLAALLSVSLVLTRPEGVFIAAVVNAYGLFRSGAASRKGWAISGFTCTTVAFACLTLFRLHHFGEVVPNTYFAKATGGSALHRLFLGARYVTRFIELVAPAIAILIVLILRRRPVTRPNLSSIPPNRSSFLANRSSFLLTALFVLYTVYILKVGGDPDAAFPLRRHFVHIVGLIALLFGILVSITSLNARKAFITSSVIAAVTALWITIGWMATPLRQSIALARTSGLLRLAPDDPLVGWFARFSKPDTLTAVSIAGQLPYLVRSRYVDMLALNDRHIAKYGTVDETSRFQDAKTDMNYVLARQPDIINGYMKASSLLAGQCPQELHTDRARMMHDMVANPTFQQHYAFIVNGPYEAGDQAIFFRTAYLDRLHTSDLVAIPVNQTVLGNPACR